MDKDKNNLIWIIIIILVVLIGGIICYSLTRDDKTVDDNNNGSGNIVAEDKDDADNTDDTDKEDDDTTATCVYLENDLEEKGLNYFTELNGKTAENGEDYTVSTTKLDDNKILVVISHLQTDHSTTDARYTIDCMTGIGTDDSDKEIDFSK